MTSTTPSTTFNAQQTRNDLLPTPPPESSNPAPTPSAKTAKLTTTSSGAIVPPQGTFVIEDDEKRLPIVYEGDTVIGPGLLRDDVYD
ncbi:hypothetical protein FRC01_014326, partial [Tulasnella sp. 417]